MLQRKRGIIHALLRMDDSVSCIESSEQTIPSYSGFNASILKPMKKHKAHFHLTHPLPPKKLVVYDMMCRCIDAAECKQMPFIQLVGDQPVYALILELKNENPEKFTKIMPMLGGFHTEGAFMSAINARFKGSDLAELLASAGLIEEGLVDQAIRGGHHNRGMRLHKLAYEAFLRLLIQDTELIGLRKKV